METNFYLPILKSKLGEFTALSHLNEEQLSKIVPLFEITPLEWDQAERKKPRTLEDHLDSFCKKFTTKWGSSNCFIDTHLLNWNGKDNTPEIEYVFDKLVINKLAPIPVVSPRSSEEFLIAFKNVTEKDFMTQIGLRVNPNDVTDPEFKENISKILKRVEFAPKNCHLIFDLVDSNFSEVEDIAESIVEILEDFPFLSEWKSFTIVGTAFPASRSIKEGLGQYKRNDWKFYKTLLTKLDTKEYSRLINYGDYSIVNPEYFEFNPKIMKSSANIRYTHDEVWIVAKGKALSKAADYLQYKKLAADVFSSGFFLGEPFSKGDTHLAKCVRGKEKPGAPSIWNWVGNNHHFTKVLTDLFP
ncbi:MAG: beta family protein [bacterium]